MKKWTKITLWVSLGIGGGIVAFVGLPLAVMAIGLSGVDPSKQNEHILTSEKVKAAGFDQKSEITLQDFNRDFPKITYIDKEAFKDNQILTKIQIPKNINVISYSAFENSNLNSIEFEKNSKLNSIYSNTFKNTRIKSIDLPDNIYRIESNVFQNTQIETFYFPPNISWIGNNLFEDCAQLKDVSFKSFDTKIKYMGYNLFKNSSIKNYTYIDTYAMSPLGYNESLINVDFSNGTYISSGFFWNLKSELDVIIPNNIEGMRIFSFANSKIKSIKFDNFTNSDKLYIEDGTFFACENLKKLELPNIPNILLEDESFIFTFFDDITMPSYLKVNNSSSPLYGFTQAQWDLIKWI